MSQPLLFIKKIKPIEANPDDIHSDNYAEEDARHSLAEFFVFRGKELIVHHKKEAGKTEKKDGIIVHRCGKIEPQSRQMRARHSAEGATDAEDTVCRAEAS